MTARNRNDNRFRFRQAMSVADALAVLGLDFQADSDAVHTTYRQLALRYHPDRNGGNEESLARFKQLTAAYQILRHKFAVDDAQTAQNSGECGRCGQYDLLHEALDGSRCCMECLSEASRRRMLPAPPVVVATCASTVVLLTLAVGCLILGWLWQSTSYSLASLALGILSLLSLAATCVTIIYTADARPAARNARAPTRRIRSI